MHKLKPSLLLYPQNPNHTTESNSNKLFKFHLINIHLENTNKTTMYRPIGILTLERINQDKLFQFQLFHNAKDIKVVPK